jgi:putative restriction endonuclease
MPRLTKSQLFEKVERAIINAGWNILYLPPQTGNPRRIQIYKGDESYRLRIYIWNMTHGGGRARPHDESRIQITGVTRFEAEVGGKTLILGWWDEAGVFAAFDFHKHAGTLGYSPSIQIREEFLRRAYRDGLSPCDKGSLFSVSLDSASPSKLLYFFVASCTDIKFLSKVINCDGEPPLPKFSVS